MFLFTRVKGYRMKKGTASQKMWAERKNYGAFAPKS